MIQIKQLIRCRLKYSLVLTRHELSVSHIPGRLSQHKQSCSEQSTIQTRQFRNQFRQKQTFSNKSQDKTVSVKLFSLMKDSKYERIYAVWFFCIMIAVCLVAMTAQKHKYTYSSSQSRGTFEMLDVDQLETIQQRRGKKIKGDKKGIEGIMDDLYAEHVASKDLDDWENVRAPRTVEPDTYELNAINKAAKLNKKSDEKAEKFVAEDYGKISENDISFDLELEEEED